MNHIKFINLTTGNVFDGSQPYIHWFEGQHSCDLIYTQPICVLTDTATITVKMDSEIFSLVNTSNILKNNDINYDEDIDGFKYVNIKNLIYEPDENDELVKIRSMEMVGTKYEEYYIYIIHFMATSPVGAEFIDEFEINGEVFKIGADFYKENESLQINLSNFGIEIPESIQRAIYNTNVHETNKDNITLNRKWKELLSNYWDIAANKGSYKSLINSLKWFEYGDLVRIREIWKHEDFGRTIYDDRSLRSVMEDKYEDQLNNFAKTTYIALYMALQKIKQDSYDDEKNPVLEELAFNWSKQDLALKMCLLGNFYETYFMPIHLDLIHSTIEDVVFTNTIKSINGSSMINREDYWIDDDVIKCNIKDDDVFMLGNVNVQVNKDTLFGTQWGPEMDYDYMTSHIIGVDEVVEKVTNKDVKTFYSQLYNGVGVVLKFECEIDAHPGDYIVREQISICNDSYNHQSNTQPGISNIVQTSKGKWITNVDHKIIQSTDNVYKINFNVLFKDVNANGVKLQFNTAGGHVYTKDIKFKIIDKQTPKIIIAKVRNSSNSKTRPINNHVFTRTPRSYNKIEQYIAAASKEDFNKNWKGVSLSNILVLIGEGYDSLLKWDYHLTKKTTEDGKIYTIGVSKEFYFDPKNIIKNIPCENIYRNDYIYIPEFHYLEEIGGDEFEDYVVTDKDTLVAIPMLGNKEFKYSKHIGGVEWEFKNVTNGDVIKLNSILEPYIANTHAMPLSEGFWDVIFRYKLTGSETKEITLNSIFLKL